MKLNGVLALGLCSALLSGCGGGGGGTPTDPGSGTTNPPATESLTYVQVTDDASGALYELISVKIDGSGKRRLNAVYLPSRIRPTVGQYLGYDSPTNTLLFGTAHRTTQGSNVVITSLTVDRWSDSAGLTTAYRKDAPEGGRFLYNWFAGPLFSADASVSRVALNYMQFNPSDGSVDYKIATIDPASGQEKTSFDTTHTGYIVWDVNAKDQVVASQNGSFDHLHRLSSTSDTAMAGSERHPYSGKLSPSGNLILYHQSAPFPDVFAVSRDISGNLWTAPAAAQDCDWYKDDSRVIVWLDARNHTKFQVATIASAQLSPVIRATPGAKILAVQ